MIENCWHNESLYSSAKFPVPTTVCSFEKKELVGWHAVWPNKVHFSADFADFLTVALMRPAKMCFVWQKIATFLSQTRLPNHLRKKL